MTSRVHERTIPRRARLVLGGLCVVAALLALASPAGAILPGPNGKVVFTSGRDDGTTVLNDGIAQLWIADRPGATPVRVTADTSIQHRHASWSPDRTKLVYSAGVAGGPFDVYILDLTRPIVPGSNPRNITQTTDASEDRPSWSPDGTRVAYQSQPIPGPGPTVIVTQQVADPMFRLVLTQPIPGNAGKPVWSNDSKTLYYSLVVNPGVTTVDDDIYAQPSDGSGVATPIVTGSTDDYQPAVSPDGQSLCFTRGQFGTTAATVQRSSIAGTNVTQIANSGMGDYNCAWSPDGAKIAYVQGIFGNGSLMVKNSDGSGTPTDLVPNVAARFDGNPEWTRNLPANCLARSVAIHFNTPTSIPLSCVDPPPENGPVTLSIASLPTHGSLGSINSTSVTYTPAHNFSGADQFTFIGNDGTSNSAPATIRIDVEPGPPPTISSLKLAPVRWRLGSGLPKISRSRAPVGTRISFNLSKPARVKLTFDRRTSGRSVHRRCVQPKRSNRTKPRCTRFSTKGSLRFTAHAGLNVVKFSGRLSAKTKLTPGDYRLTVDATDSAGKRSRARTANFTIVAG